MFVLSLSSSEETAKLLSSFSEFQWIPTDPQWINYWDALNGIGGNLKPAKSSVQTGQFAGNWVGFVDATSNTIFITVWVIIGQVLSCSIMGYAFARLRFRGKKLSFALILATMMLPGQVTMIPSFLIFRWLGWVDTFYVFIVPAFLGSAFYIFLFRQFFAGIPEDLMDAAKLDGLGHLGLWWHIFLPMSKPVLAIVSIFTFIGTWNDFLGPLIYLQSGEKRTLALALANLFNTGGFQGIDNVNVMMAASLATMIPCIILFLIAQKYFIKGLNISGIKG